jgi:transketolase
MKENEKIWLLCGGVGYKVMDAIQKDFSNRMIDCESSEQAMVDIAVGLALSGKIPFVYSITPFLYRAFEGIRIYLNHEKIPVRLVGVGRNKDYGPLGFTHYAEDDKDVFGLFPNIVKFWPNTKEELSQAVNMMVTESAPYYLNITRE